MNGEQVVIAEDLGKKYVIGHNRRTSPYTTFRDIVMQNAHAVWKKTADLMKGNVSAFGDTTEDVWALRNLSFEIRRGETLGIIGRNGSGKSTLLKVMSQITEPTEGRVRIRGRVASLLEVGTGFHPELTGRENIYLSGAVLGMSRQEIRRKFEEIVAFSEVERFLDTPVKRYSSGMYVRLAFGVAAHLEPEILLVDEVLAVGDAAFQKKCLGKMSAVASGGRTVLFVSHNMAAVTQLCRRVLCLASGRLISDGSPNKVIAAYLADGAGNTNGVAWDLEDSPGDDTVRGHAVSIAKCADDPAEAITTKDSFELQIAFWRLRPTRVVASFHVYNQQGILVFSTSNAHDSDWVSLGCEPDLYRCVCTIPGQLLNAGRYYVHAFVWPDFNGKAFLHLPDVITFEILDNQSEDGLYYGSSPGVISPALQWSSERVDAHISAGGGRPRN